MQRERYDIDLSSVPDFSREMSAPSSFEELVQAACVLAPRHEGDLVNLPCVAEQIAAHYEEMADEKAVRIFVEIAPDALIIGDVADLHRAIAQLVLDALGRAPCGGRVLIFGETSGGMVTLTISGDESRNMAAHLPNAWDCFCARWRESRHAPWDGQILVEEIVAEHGGHLETMKNSDDGLSVALWLPVHG